MLPIHTLSFGSETPSFTKSKSDGRVRRKPRPRQLTLAELPASFREDLDAYLAHLAQDRADGRSPYASSTILQRGTELRLAASELARALGDAGTIANLATLVDPQNAQTILTEFIKRRDDGEPSTFIRTLMKTLLALARDWANVTPSAYAELKTLQAHLEAQIPGLSAKSLDVLARLRDERTLLSLLAVPARLLGGAQLTPVGSPKRLLQARTALAIEILLHTGLRVHQLANLRVTEVRSHDSSGTVRIAPSALHLPCGSPMIFEIGGDAAKLVRACLDELARLAPRKRSSDWLFAKQDGRRINDTAMADAIGKATARLVGFAVTPAQLRHLCAQLLASIGQGSEMLIRDLLGHRYYETTVDLYSTFSSDDAAARWYQTYGVSDDQNDAATATHAQAA